MANSRFRKPSRRAGGFHGRPKKTSYANATSRHGDTRTKVSTSFMEESPKLSFDQEGLHVPAGNSELLLTRRQLLYGAAGVVGLIAVGAGVSAFSKAEAEKSAVHALTVSTDQVFTQENCSEVARDDVCTMVGSYNLEYGTLVWAQGSSVAACLVPTEEASPLATVGLLGLLSGYVSTVLDKAVGYKEGFEVYDVRACDKGMIWAEAEIMSGLWRLYVAPLSETMTLGEPVLVDDGDSTTQMPTIACIDKSAFWQIEPTPKDKDSTEPQAVTESVVRMTTFSKPSDVSTVYTANGSMASPINLGPKGVVITPRYPNTRSYRQLLYLDKDTGEELDSVALPSGMNPLEASYGPTGFNFCFENIYNYGGGISNLGTYAPAKEAKGEDLNDVNWFHFARTPSMPPAWMDDWLLIKSTTAVVAVNVAEKLFCSFGVESGIDDYGDCLASVGCGEYAVTMMNLDNSDAIATTDTKGPEKTCLVRVFTLKKAQPTPEQLAAEEQAVEQLADREAVVALEATPADPTANASSAETPSTRQD